MASVKRSASAPGRQPWDPANGLRVGVFVGALLGGAVAAISSANALIVVATAAIGGAVGYWSERRKRLRDIDGHRHDR